MEKPMGRACAFILICAQWKPWHLELYSAEPPIIALDGCTPQIGDHWVNLSALALLFLCYNPV